MPRLLDRYILRELLVVLGLTVAISVTVIAFGATIKPLAGDDLLTATQTLKYLGLAMVPMLQFAVPFAAGFATTLVFHRLVNDNEILAAAASGISYPRLLLPILALAAVLTILMFVLTHTVIPRFWGKMHDVITEDVTNLFLATIRSGEAFQLGELQVYADLPRVQPAPANTDATERIILERPAFAELDNDGRIARDVTASFAVIDVYRRDRRTVLTMVMRDAVYYSARTGELGSAPELTPRRPIVIADPLRDDSTAMTSRELRRVLETPDEFADIIRARHRLADVMARHAALARLDEALRSTGELVLDETGAEPRRYTVRADRLVDGVLQRDDGPVVVHRLRGDVPTLRFEAEEAELRMSEYDRPDALDVDLILRRTTVTDLRGEGASTSRRQNRFQGLQLSGVGPERLDDMSAAELLERAERLDDPPDRLRDEVEHLSWRLRRLELEIMTRIMERHALSILAIFLPLLGALLAIAHRRGTPLVIYLGSFLPAILTFLLISAGKSIVRDDEVVFGLTVMWLGHILLAAFLIVVFLRVARN